MSLFVIFMGFVAAARVHASRTLDRDLCDARIGRGEGRVRGHVDKVWKVAWILYCISDPAFRYRGGGFY